MHLFLTLTQISCLRAPLTYYNNLTFWSFSSFPSSASIFLLCQSPWVHSTSSQFFWFFNVPPASGAIPVSDFQVVLLNIAEWLLPVPSIMPNPPNGSPFHLWVTRVFSRCQALPDTFLRKLSLGLLNSCFPTSLLGILFLRIPVSYASLNCISIFTQGKKCSKIFLHFSCLILNHAILALNRWPSFLLYWKSRGHLVQPP